MILITSFGEFSFFSLFNILLSFFLVHFTVKKNNLKPLGRIVLCCLVFALCFQQGCMLQWVRNSEGRLVRISVPQGAYSESSLNLDQMEHLEGEQHSEYPME